MFDSGRVIRDFLRYPPRCLCVWLTAAFLLCAFSGIYAQSGKSSDKYAKKVVIFLDASRNMEIGDVMKLAAGELAERIRNLISGSKDYTRAESGTMISVEVFATKNRKIFNHNKFNFRIGYGALINRDFNALNECTPPDQWWLDRETDIELVFNKLILKEAERPDTVVLVLTNSDEKIPEFNARKIPKSSYLEWIRLPRGELYKNRLKDLKQKIVAEINDAFINVGDKLELKRRLIWDIVEADANDPASNVRKLHFRVSNRTGKTIKYCTPRVVDKAEGAKCRLKVVGVKDLRTGTTRGSDLTIQFVDRTSRDVKVKFFLAVQGQKPPMNRQEKDLTFKFDKVYDIKLNWLKKAKRIIRLKDLKGYPKSLSFTIDGLAEIKKFTDKGAVSLDIVGLDNAKFNSCILLFNGKKAPRVIRQSGKCSLLVNLKEPLIDQNAAIALVAKPVGDCKFECEEPQMTLTVVGSARPVIRLTADKISINKKREFTVPLDLNDVESEVSIKVTVKDNNGVEDVKDVNVKPDDRKLPVVKWDSKSFVKPASITIAVADGSRTYLCSTDGNDAQSITIPGDRISLNIAPRPVPDFSFVPPTGPAPLKVRFQNRSRNATSYKWDFDNGKVSNEENPVTVYAKPGKYQVKLTAINADGEEVTGAPKTIVINPPPKPVPRFTVSKTRVQAPANLNFTNRSEYGVRFTWDMGDGRQQRTSQLADEKFAYKYTKPGDYKVVLTAYGPTGESVAFEKEITVEGSSSYWMLVLILVVVGIVIVVFVKFFIQSGYTAEVAFFRNGKPEAKRVLKSKRAMDLRAEFQADTPLKIYLVYDREDEVLALEFRSDANQVLVNSLNGAKVVLKANVRGSSVPLGKYRIDGTGEEFQVREVENI